jgi:malate permease and related proteins
MTETLLNAYTPLIIWTGLGLLLFRFVPQQLPRLLGRSLYWVGVPLEVMALARQTDFSQNIGLAPVINLAALGMGLGLAGLSLLGLNWLHAYAKTALEPGLSDRLLAYTAPLVTDRHRKGSFLIAATLGNTGFVGLAIAPAFISEANLGWAVFYSVTNNVVGTYGFGVLIASYFGRTEQSNHWWIQLRDVLTVPSLWAFLIAVLSQPVQLPLIVESGLQASVWFVIPCAFLLMGMRLSQLQGLKSFRLALLPVLIKSIVLPSLVGVGSTLLGIVGDPRLAVVLMAAMPSAFAGLILAEEYDLDRELATSSIALTTIALLVTVPLWLTLFH